jgi:hypothetical protein
MSFSLRIEAASRNLLSRSWERRQKTALPKIQPKNSPTYTTPAELAAAFEGKKTTLQLPPLDIFTHGRIDLRDPLPTPFDFPVSGSSKNGSLKAQAGG